MGGTCAGVSIFIAWRAHGALYPRRQQRRRASTCETEPATGVRWRAKINAGRSGWRHDAEESNRAERMARSGGENGRILLAVMAAKWATCASRVWRATEEERHGAVALVARRLPRADAARISENGGRMTCAFVKQTYGGWPQSACRLSVTVYSYRNALRCAAATAAALNFMTRGVCAAISA